MKRRKRKLYTLLFIPDDNGKTFSIRLYKIFLYFLLTFIVVFILGVIFLFIRSGKIGEKLQLTESLINENRLLKKENNKIKSIIDKIESIDQTSAYIKRLSSAVGETNLELPIAKITISEKEKIFINDSLDTFIDKVRSNESEIFNYINSNSVSREELSVSIPNISPVEGWITKRFKKDFANPSLNHLGIDFAAQSGTLIRATAPGVVKTVANDKYYGLLVTIGHKFGFTTRYGHCMQILVSKGDNVERGQTIALLGNTGRSSAPHLHYEILKDNKHVDPLKFIFDRLD